MSCAPLGPAMAGSIAASLQAIDCQSAATAALAFGRLFGRTGGLTATLTLLLTLYVGLLAVGLLTGRTRIGLAALTPRMMVLGLVLTFATSWMAYQNVIWSLLTGGPDQIGGIVLGIKGSASQAFARRLDLVFAVVTDAAARSPGAPDQAHGTSPGDMLSYAALLLLLGTVGVLVSARIALAAMLALGPVFIVLALFGGTRGLFEGWLKITVMLALVPLFAVLLGAGTIAAIGPMLADLGEAGADMRQATTVFVAAAVHCALMLLSLRLVMALVQSWRPARVGGPDRGEAWSGAAAARTLALAETSPVQGETRAPTPGGSPRDERIRALVTASASLPLSQSPPGGPLIGPVDQAERSLAAPLRSAARANEIARVFASAPARQSLPRS
jgi:type IV secretion system protein VirB6